MDMKAKLAQKQQDHAQQKAAQDQASRAEEAERAEFNRLYHEGLRQANRELATVVKSLEGELVVGKHYRIQVSEVGGHDAFNAPVDMTYGLKYQQIALVPERGSNLEVIPVILCRLDSQEEYQLHCLDPAFRPGKREIRQFLGVRCRSLESAMEAVTKLLAELDDEMIQQAKQILSSRR